MTYTVKLTKPGEPTQILDDTFLEQNRALSFAEGVVEGINQAHGSIPENWTVEVIDPDGKPVE
jgi:hypothetical protein